jgi:hypothetical protein
MPIPLRPHTRTIRLLLLVGAGGQDCRTLRTQGPEWSAPWVRVTSTLMRRHGLLTGGCQGRARTYSLTEEGQRMLVPHLIDLLGNMRVPSAERAEILPIFSALQAGDLSAVPAACAHVTAP